MNGRDSVSPKGAAQHMHLNGDGAEGQAATAAPQQSSALTQETIVLLPPSGLPSAGTTALAPNGVGGSQHCHHLLGQQGTQQQDGSGLQGPGTTTSNNIKPKPAPNKFNPIDHIFQFHHALRQELRQLEADALQVEVALQQGSQPQQQGMALVYFTTTWCRDSPWQQLT
jgi:zinc finger-like protein